MHTYSRRSVLALPFSRCCVPAVPSLSSYSHLRYLLAWYGEGAVPPMVCLRWYGEGAAPPTLPLLTLNGMSLIPRVMQQDFLSEGGDIYVSVYLRRADILMTEHGLDEAKVSTTL